MNVKNQSVKFCRWIFSSKLARTEMCKATSWPVGTGWSLYQFKGWAIFRCP